jgi:hypothetical protein
MCYKRQNKFTQKLEITSNIDPSLLIFLSLFLLTKETSELQCNVLYVTENVINREFFGITCKCKKYGFVPLFSIRLMFLLGISSLLR